MALLILSTYHSLCLNIYRFMMEGGAVRIFVHLFYMLLNQIKCMKFYILHLYLGINLYCHVYCHSHF